MAIKELVHGKNDYMLWGHVGRFIVDRKVQEEMGNCISSEPGDVWWVSLTHKSETKGFSSARMMKNGHLYLRYFFVSEKSELGEEALILKAINHAKKNGCRMVYTNARKNSATLKNLKFKQIPRARGDFSRWELEIDGDGK